MDALQALLESFMSNYPLLISWIGNLIAGLCIFTLGMFVGRWARKRVRTSAFGGRHLDATLKPVLASAIFYAIIAVTLYAMLIKIGIPPSALLAVFGAAGLAIGLSLKDTLSNIAAGIMLLVLRPLAVGEYVCLGADAGTITEVGLFATTMKTSEGIYLYIPNSNVWDTRIQNFGRHSIRKFTTEIGVSYDSDLREAQRAILSALTAAPDRIADASSEPNAFVTIFGDTAITISAQVWLPADNWGTRTSDLRVEILEALKDMDIEIPFPQRIVTMKVENDLIN